MDEPRELFLLRGGSPFSGELVSILESALQVWWDSTVDDIHEHLAPEDLGDGSELVFGFFGVVCSHFLQNMQNIFCKRVKPKSDKHIRPIGKGGPGFGTWV